MREVTPKLSFVPRASNFETLRTASSPMASIHMPPEILQHISKENVQLMLIFNLHGAQTLGGIYGKQREHRRDEAPYKPRPEELPSVLFRPRSHRPAEPRGNKTNAPNRSVGVPKLQTVSLSISRERMRVKYDVRPCSAAQPRPKKA